MHPTDRRQFLARSTALAAGATALGADKPAPMPILDTHQHLWDRKRFRLPWVKKGSVLDRDYLTKDYLAATAGLHVVRAVYMEVDVDPAQQLAEAEYVIGLCGRADAPTVAGVISGRPASDGFAKYLANFKGSAVIKGVRQVLHGSTPVGTCTSKEFVRGVRLLGEYGMSFDLCMRPGELKDAVKLVDACPDTAFVLDHCGNPDLYAKDTTPWKKDITDLAKRKNVVAKVSGIVASARPKWTADDLAPFVNHTLDAFGPDRVMFAGDWPVCTLRATFRQWVDALRAIVAGRKEEERRKLFHDNAVRFYGLEE